MSARLLVRAAGPGVTVQDAGRRGLLRYGVTPAGPMDASAFAIANLAAGAASGAGALEVSIGGVELEAEGATIGLSVAGGAFDATLDAAALPPACVLALEPGARLRLRAGAWGAFAYVGFFGRLDLPLDLGSLATHSRAGLGGRGLRAGDVLPLSALRPPPAAPRAVTAPCLARRAGPLRVMLGPQDDYFSQETINAFLSARWRIGARSDRMAYRLEGPRLAHAKGHDIVSDGVALGAIQVPGDGAPLALMADRQPTGGYPKIAHVITADIGALAQMRPGEEGSFVAVTWDEATRARRALSETIRIVEGSPELSAEALLSENLIGGVISADEKN